MTTENINDSFFKGIYKEVWKNMFPQALTEAEIDFIEQTASVSGGTKVLDFMCGHGRHALGLAKRGFEVTAVDIQPDYIQQLISSAKSTDLNVKAVEAHALSFETTDRFDCITCMGNSFSFFNENDTKSILNKFSRFLSENGSIIINSWMIAEIAIRHFKDKDWHYVNDYKCLLDYSFRFHPSRIESEQVIISPEGAIEELKAIDYIYSLNELGSMLAVEGLVIKDLFSTPRKKKFSLGDTQVYILIGHI